METIAHTFSRALLHQAARLSALLLIGSAALLTGCSGVRDTSRTFNTVVIDAGHGGHDVGARSGTTGMAEKTVALDVAQGVEKRLRAAGFRTRMTRNGDQFIPLDKRAAISNGERNAVFVSVHFNHARTHRASGTETFYNSGASAALAAKVQRSLARVTPTPDRGVKTANFRVLRKARYPAILVECGFLSNAAEARLAASPAYRAALADSIASGIIEQRYGLDVSRAQRFATQ